MKKKNLKTLRLTKSTISSLRTQTISGGTDSIIIAVKTIIRTIPIPQATVTGCSQFMECDSVAACTGNVCKTNEVDTETRPVC
ncbi:hypothetical protein H2O64_14775 [Kordia sp. YSTF-M3]|uniref:Uncharacterized protein n=1 Tax=Kordia aestuariivivens TaxID=2759037 RepID=A0ABR7QBJ9_9FLAO|nr:hypothetical protein [Kordia aestuariivivens]MBC8755940.1 hypothetical protein [Kordia aestuariivivens]